MTHLIWVFNHRFHGRKRSWVQQWNEQTYAANSKKSHQFPVNNGLLTEILLTILSLLFMQILESEEVKKQIMSFEKRRENSKRWFYMIKIKRIAFLNLNTKWLLILSHDYFRSAKKKKINNEKVNKLRIKWN